MCLDHEQIFGGGVGLSPISINEEQRLTKARIDDYGPAPRDASEITVQYPGIVINDASAVNGDGAKDALIVNTGAPFEASKIW